jgi:2-polyprenyl-3-methyl-5-hydroxy-6-metoxy-1,4-benzoquinol methylase
MLQSSTRRLLCPACGVLAAHQYLYAKNGCDILRCAECGLGRAEAVRFDPGAYYTEDYFSGGHADGYADYRGAERVLRREFARTVDFIRRYRPNGKLLDIGCAYGFFLQEAKPYFDVAGIELAQSAAAHCRQSGLNVVTGIADETTLETLGNMDVMVLLDVVEHLPDPHATLALCARRLNPDGIIVLTTGDFGSPVALLMGARWRLMTPPQHLWFFTAASMQRLSRRLQLRLERLDRPWKIVPLSLATFQLRRMLGLAPARTSRAGNVGVPVNLFDAMRVVLRRTES